MSWRRDPRARVALSAWLCAAACTAVHAGDERLLLELLLDGRSTGRVAQFVVRGDTVQATAFEWRSLGMRLPAASASDQEVVAASKLPGVEVHVDRARQTLVVRTLPDLHGLTRLEPAAPPSVPLAPVPLGAVLNYDLSAQRGRERDLNAGLFEARVFGAAGVLEHTMLVSDAARPHTQRLHTTYTWSDPERTRRLRVGDTVSSGLAWTRPVRLGGVQLATDFALRPDLVTQPVPLVAGSVAVPSTVDVLVNGVRQLSQPVEPGRFEVRQPPGVSGAGAVSVVVRDALGRETVQTLPFYSSARLLGRGLSAYAMEFGRVRRDFGLPSSRYGERAGAATVRHGWSENLTLEAHAQATAGTRLIGAGGALGLAQWGIVNGGLAKSNGGSAWLVDAGYARQSELASFSFATTRAAAGYSDIAAAQGEPVLRHATRASAGASVGRFGTVGAAWVATTRHAGSGPAAQAAPLRTRVLTASWSVALGPAVQAYTSVFRDFMTGGAAGASLTLAIPFGGGGSVAGSLSHDRRGSSFSLQASRAALGVDEAGWRVRTDSAISGDAPSRQLAEVELRAPLARVSAGIERTGNTEAARLGVQGALIALDGRLHASLPVPDSVAVVSTGAAAGVAVYLENRYAGRTDRNGQLVVAGLLSYQTNRLAIDVLDLPMDSETPLVAIEVRPADRSAALVRFPSARRHAALIELHDASGAPLPAGGRVFMRGAEQAFVVGHDGQAYLHGVQADNELLVRGAGASSCTARFAWQPAGDEPVAVRRVRCE